MDEDRIGLICLAARCPLVQNTHEILAADRAAIQWVTLGPGLPVHEIFDLKDALNAYFHHTGPDRGVTRRYITKKSPCNVGMADFETSLMISRVALFATDPTQGSS